MIEIPEATVIARELDNVIVGKTIKRFVYGFSEHKFTFFNEEMEKNSQEIIGKQVSKIVPRCFYIEILIEDYTLLFRDGTNIRYHKDDSTLPKKHQLLIEFDDSSFITVSVSMYGCIDLCKGKSENKYYNLELKGVSPLVGEFSEEYFLSLINDDVRKNSAKAFIATGQRIPGIGNGVTQDILFNACINPKTKIKELTDKEILNLYYSLKNTILDMISMNGRDTEKDIYGVNGGYKTIMSKNNVNGSCPVCNNNIKKENYLGGSIYYCPKCQKLEK